MMSASGILVGNLGDKFRQTRESKKLSLEDVSDVTKINRRMLQAIEDERFDLLPGGVFNKGFIRAYAKHLGLDDEEAITSYLACLSQAQVDAHEVWDPAQPVPRRTEVRKPNSRDVPPVPDKTPAATPEVQARRKTEPPIAAPPRILEATPTNSHHDERTSGIPWTLFALAALVVALAAFLWIRHHRAAHSQVANSAAAVAPAPAATGPAVAPVNPPAATPVSTSAAPKTSSPAPTQPANSQPAAATAAKEQPFQGKPDQNSNAAGNSEVTVRKLDNAPSSATAPAPLTLVIHATEDCWISIRADGDSIDHETLTAPANASFHATHEIVARIGNAAGVTFVWNGKEIPVHGAEAEVKTFVFNSTGMREVHNPGDSN
jgi:cytoskeletal protein RodZ